MRKILALLFALALFAFAPLSVPASAQTSAVPGPAYRISPGDDLEIMVWGDERLQRVVRVLPDGSFGFPLVGQVMAAGLLPSELERVITVALKSERLSILGHRQGKEPGDLHSRAIRKRAGSDRHCRRSDGIC
jgi:protein involved in polysaccharide export with SLBB domain